MAKIVFNYGMSFENLPPVQERRMVDIEAIRAGLDGMRKVWKGIGSPDLDQLFDDLLAVLVDDHQAVKP